METLKFKTNIKCGGCVATITPILNEQDAIRDWSVDTTIADKLLTVQGEMKAEEVVKLIEKAGFTAVKI